MFALVEPTNMNTILDRPHLGCAMLIAASQEKGIKTTLVKGQARYLKDMFLNDSEELWDLIQNLRGDDLEKIGISSYKKFIQKKGKKQFQNELKNLYQNVIINKDPRYYFNALLVERLNSLVAIFTSIYFYYLEELNYNKLRIVDRYISEIIKTNPRYIGFSLDKFDLLSRNIRRRIKEQTKIPIIAGGSLTPFIDFKKLNRIFKDEYFDYLIIGAGEEALPSLIDALENKKEPKGIANVFYKKDGKVKGNDLEVINNLDNLPYPDYSQFDLDFYLTPSKILPLQSTRGCSWKKCAFCSHHNIDLGNYKTFSIGKIIETFKYLQNTYKCSHFFLNDEELPPKRAELISEAILNNKLDICVDIRARLVEGYNNNNLLKFMRKAGFTSINWGVESGSQRVLDLMNKGTKVSNISQILKKSSKNKIANLCFAFFGFPGETKTEMHSTVKFLKDHADYIDNIMPTTFDLDSCSPIGKNPEKWGVNINEDGSFSVINGLNRKDVSTFYSALNEKLKLNSIKLTSDKLRYLLPGHNRRTAHFLISSHMLLSNRSLARYIKGKKMNNVFPIILGEIRKKDGKVVLNPVNVKETTFINQYHPEKERVLDKIETRIFNLSDGTLSKQDIILTIHKEFKRKYSKECVHKRCIDFFQEIFSKNCALAFKKSWHLSYVR